MLLKVGLHTYDVTFPDVVTDQGKDVFGLTDTNTLTIQISSSVQHSLQVETLIHEICHACFYFSYLWKQNKPDEELIVSQMAFFLSSVFIDNPWVLKFIQEGRAAFIS